MRRYFLMQLLCLCLTAVIGCSKRNIPPLPKTQPELLLEIYDAARKEQYNAALLKIQKMKALDPTSVFLAELENTIQFNRLTAVVNAYLQMGKFEEALNTLLEYEKKHGYTDYTTKIKEQLLFIARLDHQIREIKTVQRADKLEQSVDELKKLTKNIALPPKIMNFIQKKESDISRLRDLETKMMLREIRLMLMDCMNAGNRRVASVFAAVYAMEVPHAADEIWSLPFEPGTLNSQEINNYP